MSKLTQTLIVVFAAFIALLWTLHYTSLPNDIETGAIALFSTVASAVVTKEMSG